MNNKISVWAGRRATWLVSTAIGLAVVGHAPESFAQKSLDEITVTAQKREQGINDVGITVNAFTADQLDNYGITSAEGLEALTPGLTVTAAQPRGVPVYTIRGIGFSDYTTAASSTVGIYMDEANLPYSVMSTGVLFDVERVEVLKGPQGDLYGRNTTAGQINFVSRKPTEDFTAGVRMDYARFNVMDVEGYVSGPVSDVVRMRLAAKTIQSNSGWQKSLSRPGETLGQRDELAVRLLTDIDINEDANLLVNLHYNRNKSDHIAPTPLALATGLTAPMFPVIFSEGDNRAADWTKTARPQADSDMAGVTAKLNWDFDGVTLTTITAYDDYDRDDLFESSGVNFPDADVRNTTDLEVFSQEIRLSSNNDSDLYWLAGVFYSHDEVAETYYLGMTGSFGFDISTEYEQTTESMAAYGHVEYSFAEDWKLTLGARYTEEDREWSGCTYDSGDGILAFIWNAVWGPTVAASGYPTPSTVLQPGECAIYNDLPGTPGYGDFGVFTSDISTNKTMWKVTLDYAPNDDMLIYGTISQGFKSGGFNGAAAQMHSQLVAYGTEELTAYELGVKSTLLDGAMQLNAAAFYYDYKDKQEPTVFISPVGPISGLTNVPKSEVMGAELEMHWMVTEGLRLDAGVAWLDTEIKEYDAIDAAASVFPNVVTSDASGFGLANSPRWQANATATYEFDITPELRGMIAGDISYKADNSEAQPLQGPISDYTLVNLRAGVSDMDGRWRVMVWGRNVFNQYYWHSESGSNSVTVRINGMPATYGVTLSYDF